jgi:hypothetical protein
MGFQPRPSRYRWTLAAGIVLAVATPAMAQRDPRVGYVYPAGGRPGTSFEATLGGQSLDGVSAVLFSGAGLRATVLRHERQPTPREQDAMVKRLAQIQEKRRQGGLTADEEREAADIRRTLTGFGRRLSNPALGEFVTLRIEIDPDAAPGRREVRLLTPVGLTNPLVFDVGRLPEVARKDWKNIPRSRESQDPALDPSPSETRISLPILLNGQIQPGGMDRYRFRAERGAVLGFVVAARELIPYISDAVPGWVQATLTLYDAQGRPLAFRDDDRFRPDPILRFDVPADGEYVLEVRDALHRGREDFVYRIAVGATPFATGLFPLGGPAGTRTRIALAGWNLTSPALTLDLRDRAPGFHPLSALAPEAPPNRLSFDVDTLPEVDEQEQADAQAVALPVIVNGRIDRPGDVDVFRFEGRAGDRVVAEVRARRLDSPLDSTLWLTDASGRTLAFNDDHADKGAGLDTHHADSYLLAELPADGVCFVHLADAQGQGGPGHAYRLRLGPPRPDFELRVAPSGVNVRGGACAPITVYALRRDGFAGPIALALKGTPEGFALAAPEVPAGRDHVTITLAAPPVELPAPLTLRLEGRASLQGREVLRPAVPADDRMQAFAYRHLVPAQEWKVAVWGRASSREPARILTATPVRIPAGGTARVEVSMSIGPQMGRIEFELFDAPPGLALGESVTGRDRAELVLKAEATEAGTRGALVILAFAGRSPQSGREEPSATPRRVPLGALPAIPYEVVGKR